MKEPALKSKILETLPALNDFSNGWLISMSDSIVNDNFVFGGVGTCEGHDNEQLAIILCNLTLVLNETWLTKTMINTINQNTEAGNHYIV